MTRAATFERPGVTAELAKAIVEAEQKAAEMGHLFVIAIVDDSGVLKAFRPMDGAPLLSVQVARDKAHGGRLRHGHRRVARLRQGRSAAGHGRGPRD